MLVAKNYTYVDPSPAVIFEIPLQTVLELDNMNEKKINSFHQTT